MIKSTQITIFGIVCVIMWNWTGWHIISKNQERYKEWISIGTITKNDLDAYLIIIGPFYLIFNKV